MSEVMEPPVTQPATAPVTPPDANTGTLPVTPAAVSPYYKEWLQSDGTLNPKALDHLPEHLAHMKPTLERQKTMDDVLGVLMNSQQLAGKKALIPLPENAPENVRSERKALMDQINGVPKDANGYGIAKPKDLPDEVWNPKMAEGFSSWAHKHSVAPAAVRELLNLNVATVHEGLKAREEYTTKFYADQQAAISTALKLENVPMDKAQELAKRGAQQLGLDLNNEQDAALMKNAKAFMMAYRHAVATGEDKFVDGNANATGGDPTKLAQDIVQNKSNPENAAYWDAGDPRHKAVVEKVQGMFRDSAARGGRK